MIAEIINWIRLTPFRIEVGKLVAKHGDGENSDNWKKTKSSLSLYNMGERCERDLSEYFNGKSNLQLTTPEKIEEWLIQCNYVARKNNKGLSDKWLHPLEFEKAKQGHCVDFSLFCWRKLCEAGYTSELVLGTRFRDSEERQHAWVIYENNGSKYIFEALPIQGRSTIEPFKNIMNTYTPWHSVSCKFSSSIYIGYLTALKL